MSQAASTTYENAGMEPMPMLDGAKKIKDAGSKILVVNLPITGEWVFRRFFESCLGMCAGSAYNYFESQKIRMLVNICCDFPIDHNRNKSVRVAIEQFGADYIMQLDTDQTFKPSTIIDLFEGINKPAPDGSEIEVLAGMYFMKNPPFRPVLGPYTSWDIDLEEKYLEKLGLLCRGECGLEAHKKNSGQLVRWSGPHFWPKDRLFRADVIGVGCVMSKASMWKKLPYPFFRYSPDPKDGQKRGDNPEVSEDMYWCAQMHKAGVKIWVDPKVQCGHLGVLESNQELCQGAFDAAEKHFNSLPDGDKEKLTFKRGLVDVR